MRHAASCHLRPRHPKEDCRSQPRRGARAHTGTSGLNSSRPHPPGPSQPKRRHCACMPKRSRHAACRHTHACIACCMSTACPVAGEGRMHTTQTAHRPNIHGKAAWPTFTSTLRPMAPHLQRPCPRPPRKLCTAPKLRPHGTPCLRHSHSPPSLENGQLLQSGRWLPSADAQQATLLPRAA